VTLDTIFSRFNAHRFIAHRSSSLKRNLLLFVFGICATLALPPVFAFPFLVPAFAGLLWLSRSAQTRRRAFFDGWWWGFGHYTTSLYWMCIALLTDPAQFGWLIPFTLIGLNGLIALYPACAMAAWHYMRPAQAKWQPLVFAALWCAMEWLRGHLLTGFPWNLAGYGWAFSDSMSQSVSVIGIYGLTFVTVLAAASFSGGRKQAGAMVAVLIMMVLAGAWRLQQAGQAEFVPNVELRLVQANINQEEKWSPARERMVFSRYVQLSRAPAKTPITHIIWPETAVPFLISDDSALAIRALGQLAPESGALITGVLRAEGVGASLRVWNSVEVFTKRGVEARYDKHHLVPFGEYVPFRAILPKFVVPVGNLDLSDGPGPRLLDIPGAPSASPLVCYEAIFPHEAVAKDTQPGWLLNVTNDAWFGRSSGPYQHFHMARLRAIEQGLPLVRAANTGISAVIDGYGRVIASAPLGQTTVVDSELPMPLHNSTIYGGTGDRYFLLLISTILLLPFYFKIRSVF